MTQNNYLKTYRKNWALSQRELGLLLGNQNELIRGRIYLYEKGAKQPSIKTALAFEVIFGETPSRTFPRFYEDIETAVMGRAAKLYARLEHKTDVKSLRKLELLKAMMERASHGAV